VKGIRFLVALALVLFWGLRLGDLDFLDYLDPLKFLTFKFKLAVSSGSVSCPIAAKRSLVLTPELKLWPS
jgi:hypothetical protein